MATVDNKYHTADPSVTDSDTASEDGRQYKGPVALAEPAIRSGFVRKVYGILGVQLAVTAAIGTWFHLYTSPEWAANHTELFLVSAFAPLIMLIGAGCCCPSALRKYPWNYLFLFTLTIFEAILIGFVVTLYTGQSVLIAVVATALVFGCLTAYACFTKSDFTGFGPYLYAALFSMMSFGLVMSLWSCFSPVPHGVRMVYAFFGVLLFSFYIVYDTQLIVGGRHKSHQFDIDDYCFAALNIYLDILNLFLYLLELFGDRR